MTNIINLSNTEQLCVHVMGVMRGFFKTWVFHTLFTWSVYPRTGPLFLCGILSPLTKKDEENKQSLFAPPLNHTPNSLSWKKNFFNKLFHCCGVLNFLCGKKGKEKGKT